MTQPEYQFEESDGMISVYRRLGYGEPDTHVLRVHPTGTVYTYVQWGIPASVVVEAIRRWSAWHTAKGPGKVAAMLDGLAS